MNIAVLCDGAGLARLGLEQAGHTCTGFELDPIKHRLSKFVGSGNCVLQDARTVDLLPFDAVWISPPCQPHSAARTQGPPISRFADADLHAWALTIPHLYRKIPVVWIEQIVMNGKGANDWGLLWNAAQFQWSPVQNRNRIVGGRHMLPQTYRPYARAFKGVCPCITATEYKGCASDRRRASRFYGRRLTVDECAYHQGFPIPDEWRIVPDGYTSAKWNVQLYEAIGNGVPVFMARAFGEMYE